MKIRNLLRAALATIIALSAATSIMAATFAPVSISGTEPPGIPGTLINASGAPRINNNGEVAYNITLKADAGLGINSSNDAVLYSGLPGSVGIVVREAGQAPGFPSGVNFVTTSNPSARALSDDGRIVFPLALAINAGAGITTSNDSVMWIGSPGNIVPLMREGNPAPGLPGLTIDAVGSSQVFLTDTSKIYQQQIVVGPGVTPDNGGTVLYAGTTPGNLSPLMRSGDPAPDAPSGVVFRQFFTIAPKGNHLLVTGALVQGQGGVTPTNDIALWATNGNGSLKLALREGGEVGGAAELVDPGTQISSFDEVAINNLGTVLTWGSKLLVDGVHASSSNDTTVLIGSVGSTFTVIAREGTPAPGLPGLNYGSSFSEARIAGTGEVLINSNLAGPGVTGTNDSAFFKGMPNNLQLLLRKGDQAPGFAAGMKLQQWGSSDFLLDGAGMFALINTVSDGTTTSEGIFITSPTTGLLELLIKRGDSLEVLPGDFRVIADLSAAFGPAGQASNEQHQLVFTAIFTDGSSGAFIASVPEPSTLALVGVCVFCWPIFRRRILTPSTDLN
jgi:hypothetical protein